MEIAPRIELSQAWWAGSELVRRHPELTLRGDDHMTYLSLIRRNNGEVLAMINPSTFHVRGLGGRVRPQSFSGSDGPLAAHDTREYIEKIEGALGLSSPKRAPSSTAHALVFRLISTALAMQANASRVWDCRNEVVSEDNEPFHRGWIERFPNALDDVRVAKLEGWEGGLAQRHFWAITRAGLPVALLSTDAVLYREDSKFDLMFEYERAGRKLLPVLAETLGDLVA